MSASIVLTGLAANDPVPGVYTEILFAQGEAGGASTSYPALLLANKTSAGSATTNSVIYGPDTAVPCQTEGDVISLFGTGSEMHRGWLRFTAVNKDTALYMLAVTASGGTAASATCVIANAATSAGNVRVFVGDDFVDTAVASGDAVDTIGAAIAASINTKTRWPVTASYNSSTDTLTLTARIAGPRGNFIKYQITSNVSGTTFSTGASLTALSSGATADDNTTALATILARRFYWIVSAAEDATQLGAVVSQVNSQALPTTGIRQRVIGGSIDSLANTITVATGLNAARCELVWQPSSELTPFELACHHAGVVSLLVTESLPKPRHNFCNFPSRGNDGSVWKIKAPRSGTGPTRADIKSALNNGITPIAALPNGNCQMVRRITTKSLTSALADYRVRDAHKVDVCDVFGDLWNAKVSLQFSGLDIADDPARGQTPPSGAVWPALLKGALYALVDQQANDGQLQRAQAIKDGSIVQRESSPADRMSVQVPLQPVDIAAQFASQILQVA